MNEIKTSSLKVFSAVGEKLVISSILVFIGYISTTIEIVNYYKHETQLLFLSTGLCLVSLTLAIAHVRGVFTKIQNQIDYSRAYGVALLVFNVISVFLLLYAYYDLKLKFEKRFDPLFDFFIGNYLYYVMINIILVLVISWILSKIIKKLAIFD